MAAAIMRCDECRKNEVSAFWLGGSHGISLLGGEEESSDETEIYGEFHIAEAEPAFEHSFRAL